MARALDVVGDRWSLLIVRNLLLGPQTWSALRDTLPGVATNLLADRLRTLVEHGVIANKDGTYMLTASGAAIEPALFALADWGERHLARAPGGEEHVRARYFMT